MNELCLLFLSIAALCSMFLRIWNIIDIHNAKKRTDLLFKTISSKWKDEALYVKFQKEELSKLTNKILENKNNIKTIMEKNNE